MTNFKVHTKQFFLAVIYCFIALAAFSQTDTSKFVPFDTLKKEAPSVSPSVERKVDSALRVHSPKKAAIRSAILPGLGQIYNKRYWKLPIIYGALGVSASVFFYNLSSYRTLRFAYKARTEATPGSPVFDRDSTNYKKLALIYKTLDPNALRTYRDEFRKNIDYSVLVFILLWGLNVVDATVDAHLRSFDVSPDLSFKIKFGRSQMAGTNGVSLVLAFK